MSIAYGAMAVLALILLVGYCTILKKRDIRLLLLYVSIAVTNIGYFLLSLSKTVSFALFANRVAYFGSVFLQLCMLMSVLSLCGFRVRRWLPVTLAVLAVVMWTLTGSIPLYYREVSLVFVNNGAKLQKVYGVLHPVYLVYTVGYFAAMIASILLSLKKRLSASRKHAALLVGVVLGNIGVWILEKFISVDFEFLSVSYLFSEIILLGLYWMMQDYVLKRDIPTYTQAKKEELAVQITAMTMDAKLTKVLTFVKEDAPLSIREREILEMVIAGKKRREIAEAMHLSENTVKTYTRTLYGKLNITCREELYELLLQNNS
jgi:DNA-binding CsgD family transcriptional regulator